MEDNSLQAIEYIDLDKVIKNRKSVLLQRLPQFIINYIKKVIHQDDLNDALRTIGNRQGSEFIKAGLEYMQVSFTVKGIENVPKNGKYVFASNHPLGGIDGLIFMSSVSKNFGLTKIIANDLLMNIKNMRSLFVGVNKHGANSREAIQLFDEQFASPEMQIAVFPAGLISRRIKGKVVDLEWKKTFLKKAIQHQRDIVPVFINGRVSNFFYNLSNIRKFLHIKSNIEMFYLPDELFKQRGKTYEISFGKPIPISVFDHRFSHHQWAQLIKQHIYTLKDDIHSEFEINAK